MRPSIRILSKAIETTAEFFKTKLINVDQMLKLRLTGGSLKSNEKEKRAELITSRLRLRMEIAHETEARLAKQFSKTKESESFPSVEIEGSKFKIANSFSDEDSEKIYSACLFDDDNNIIARCAVAHGSKKEKSHHILFFNCSKVLEKNQNLVFALLMNDLLEKITLDSDNKISEIRTSCIQENIDKSLISNLVEEFSYQSRITTNISELQTKIKEFLKENLPSKTISDEMIKSTFSPETYKKLTTERGNSIDR